MVNNSPIGIFDSGVGGLTVLKQALKYLPNEQFIYLGDTARVPYGTKSPQIIEKFALELTGFLLRKNVKVLVVACNTISAIALEKIKAISPVPVLDVIEPTVKEAIKLTKTAKIGVIGTTVTINSGIYQKKIKGQNSDLEVISKACPLFVPIVEEGFENHKSTKDVASKYLKGFDGRGIDTLILGCTHYPLLKGVISKTVGRGLKLIDSAEPTAKLLFETVQQIGIRVDNKPPKNMIYVTDNAKKVSLITKQIFEGEVPGMIEEVVINDY